MSGEVSGGFTDIGLQKCEKRFGLRKATCQEVAAPCHEGGERHEKAGEEDIAGSLSLTKRAGGERSARMPHVATEKERQP